MEEGCDLPSLLEELLVDLESTRLPRTLPKKKATIVTNVIKHVNIGNMTHFDQVHGSVAEELTTRGFNEGIHKMCRNVASLVIDGGTEVRHICKSLLLSLFLTKDAQDVLI